MSMFERKVVTGLIVSDAFIKRVVDGAWSADQFESPDMGRIARWAFEHYAKYGKAPNRDIEQIFLAAVRDEQIPKADAQHIEDILEVVSDEYEHAEDINVDYLYDQMVQHFRTCHLKIGISEADILLQQGKVEHAITAIVEAAADAIETMPSGDLSRPRAAAWRIAVAGGPEERLPDPWGDPEPPEFDLSMLPPVLRYFAEQKARSMGVDASAVVWAELAACSGALNGSLRLQMKRTTRGFQVPPGLWVLFVGEPSALKTPIFDEAFAPLRAIQADYIRQYDIDKRRWEADPDKIGDGAPTFVQLMTHDSTTEGLRDLLATQDRGIVAFNDEWTRHIGSMGRYSGGRDAGAADRAFYNDAWNGGERVFNRAGRKGGERIVVRNLQITVIGGIQPDMLRKFNRNGELTADGMLQRSCVILVSKSRIGSDIDTTGIESHYERLIRCLEAVPGNRTLTLTEAAAAIRARVEQRLFPYQQNDALGLGFKTAVGKLHGMWGRLALTIEHVLSANREDPPEFVGERAATLAERLLFESLIPNMARFYQMLGGGGDLETTRFIAGFLLREQRTRVTGRDIVLHVGVLHRAKVEQVREAMSPLVSMGWLTPEGNDDYRARAWIVNPAIYAQFAEQANKARADAVMARSLIARRVAGSNELDTGSDPADVYDVYRAHESDFGDTHFDSKESPDPELRLARGINIINKSPDIPEPEDASRARDKHHKHSLREAIIRNAMRQKVSRSANSEDAE